MKINKNLIFLLIILFLAFGIMWVVKNSIEKTNTIETVENNLKALEAKTESFKDESRRWRAKTLAAEGTINQLSITHKSKLDSVEKYYNIKIKNLKSSVSIGTLTEIGVTIPLAPINITNPKSKNLRKFSLSNKWYNINGKILAEKVSLNINVFDSISIATYWHKERFWKERELKVEAVSFNPYTKVNFVNSIDVNNSYKPRWVVAPMAAYGVGYEFKPQFFVGFGIGYKLFEF